VANAAGLGTSVPHFEWLKNADVFYDALGNNERCNVPGSAFGQISSLTTRTSQIGYLTDASQNRIVVVQENFSGDHDNPLYGMAMQTGAYGANPITITLPRGEGGGWHERLREKIQSDWTSTDHNGRTTKTPSLISQLAKIEASGNTGRTIVVQLGGKPPTSRRVADLASQWADLAITLAAQAAGPYVSSLLGVSRETFDSAIPTIKRLATGEPVRAQDLATAAGLCVSTDIRSTLETATQAYEATMGGDYARAAKLLGVDTAGMVRQALDGVADAGVPSAVQNIWNMDTVNAVRAQLRSGTARQSIIDQGTATAVPSAQNLLLMASYGMTAAVPRLQELVGTIMTETRDATAPPSHRSLMQMFYGRPVTPGSLDALAMRAMVERGLAYARQGQMTWSLPSIIPVADRARYQAEIERQTGTRVTGTSWAPWVIPALAVAAIGGIYLYTRR